MTIPAPSDLKSKTKKFYGQSLGPEADEYLDMIFGKIESAWKAWQDSMAFGQILVSGGGVGAWAGVGNGGVMSGQPFVMQEPFIFKGNSPQQLKFTKALADTLQQKFSPFPASFKFSAVQYTGTSGATPITPGPVSATCVSAPLDTMGKGSNPSGIADAWAGLLQPPEFQLDNPRAKSGDLIKAIAKAIEQSFQSVWIVTAQISGNSFSGAGAPGGVVTGFPTSTDGKVL
jgi:hypothetical protein